jgi:hypothetical protein
MDSSNTLYLDDLTVVVVFCVFGVIDINIFDRRSHRKKITKENLG